MPKSCISLLASAGLVLAAAAQAAEPVSVIRMAGATLFVQGQTQHVGIAYVIEKQGWLRSELAKRGIKLEWYPVSNAAVGPQINEAFASHAIQFGSYGDLPAIILNGNGGIPRTQLLVPAAPGDAFLLVPANSSAKSIEDLKGKKLAIHKGRPWELPLLRLLDSKKLSYSDFQIYNIDPDSGAAALASGAIDGLFTISGYALEEKGVAKIIWSTKQAPLDWKMGMGLWGAKDFIDQHPDLTQLIVTAYVKADQWASLEANRDTMVKLDTLNGTSANVARLTYDNDPHLTWKNRWSPEFTPWLYEHYRQTINYAVNKHIIRKPIDQSTLLNDRFVNAALNSLSLQNYWTAPAQSAALSVASH